VVSLGTGRIPVTSVQSVNVFRPEGILDVKRLVTGFTALVNMMVDQVCIVWQCTLIWPQYKCLWKDSYGQQFHRYQQNEQPPVTSNNWMQKRPLHIVLGIQVLFGTGTKMWQG